MHSLMNQIFTQVVSAVVLLVGGAVIVLLVWGLHRQWWRVRRIRRLVIALPLVGFGVALLWTVVRLLDISFLERIFGFVASFLFVLTLFLLALLPISGLLLSSERLAWWGVKRRRARIAAAASPDAARADTGRTDRAHALVPTDRERKEILDERNEREEIDQGRRALVAAAAGAIPLFAIGGTAVGVLQSQDDVVYPEVTLRFRDLPPALDGLRILHLSDLHLGYYIRLADLEMLLNGAEGLGADLMVVTGDLSDDLPVFATALSMIAQLPTRHGTFASLGNHEYYRGIDEVLKAYDKGSVPLLRESGQTLSIGGTDLYIGASDDPAALGRSRADVGDEKGTFLDRSVAKALDGAPSDAFTIMLTHRPEGFDGAAMHGVDLTLAGHTHAGGQMGWNGRSFVETWLGIGKYMWGHYEKNDGRTQLYTTAGAGHWLPFRLGVPREVPVYTLKKG